MKIYVKNKNFIPAEFIDSVYIKSNKNNSRLIMFLLIINIFIIPTSISNIKNSIKSKEVIVVANINNEDVDVNKEKIIRVISMINNDISSVEIQNNFGTMEFNSIEEIFKIEKEEKIKINVLKINSKTSVSAEVEL